MKRRRTRRSFLSSNLGKLHALNPALADFLSNLSSGGADAVLTNDFTASRTVGGVENETFYAAGTSLEQILIELLTGEVAGQITNFFISDPSAVIPVGDSNVRMAGDEPIEIASISYTINDPNSQFTADSGTATLTTNGVNGALTVGTGLGVDHGVGTYSNIAFDNSTTYTVGTNTGGYEDFPWTTNHFLNTTVAITAEKSDATNTTPQSRTVQHVLPCFLLPVHLMVDSVNYIDSATNETHITDMVPIIGSLEALNNYFQSLDPNYAPFTSATTNLLIEKLPHSTGATPWNSKEWSVPAVTPPVLAPNFAGPGFIDAWKYLLFVPRSRYEVTNAIPITVIQENSELTSSIVNTTGIPVDVNLTEFGIITDTPNLWNIPYQMYEFVNANALSDGASAVTFKFEE
jgi:hypothetical protein